MGADTLRGALHVAYVIIFFFCSDDEKMTYATCKAPLRVSAPTVIPVCNHWNRGKMEVLSAEDGRMGIQGQTNIRPLPRLITSRPTALAAR